MHSDQGVLADSESNISITCAEKMSCAERPVTRLCTERLAGSTSIHEDNNAMLEDGFKNKSQKATANQLTNEDDSGPAFNMDSEASPISGGILSSRLTSHVMSLSEFLPVSPNRLRIKDERAHVFPTFAGCPPWAKPLLYQEFQVAKKHRLII